MKKHTSDTPCLSIPTWETLEGWIRDEIEVRIQSIAEEEVTQFLGRGWYERKGTVDAAPGYRNGYGKLRRLSTSCGTIKIKRPRVRGLKERFESRILPLFANCSQNFICTVWLKATSNWPCGVCPEMERRCLHRRLPDSAANGKPTTRPGKNDAWMIASWSTPGPTASMSKPAWRRIRRACWSSSAQ